MGGYSVCLAGLSLQEIDRCSHMVLWRCRSLLDWSMKMNDKNVEMIDELRKFVIDTAKNAEKATPAQLEAMTEAAQIVVDFDVAEVPHFLDIEQPEAIKKALNDYSWMLDIIDKRQATRGNAEA